MRLQRPQSTTRCEGSTLLVHPVLAVGVSSPCSSAFSSCWGRLVRLDRVQVTVVDGSGRRFPVRGMEGQTLVEVLESQQGPLDVSDCEFRKVFGTLFCVWQLGAVTAR